LQGGTHITIARSSSTLAWNNPSSIYDDIAIEVEHVVNDSIEEDLLAQENLS
jgi:hypothetical protein